MSDLFGNPQDRFCHVVAHNALKIVVNNIDDLKRFKNRIQGVQHIVFVGSILFGFVISYLFALLLLFVTVLDGVSPSVFRCTSTQMETGPIDACVET